MLAAVLKDRLECGLMLGFQFFKVDVAVKKYLHIQVL